MTPQVPELPSMTRINVTVKIVDRDRTLWPDTIGKRPLRYPLISIIHQLLQYAKYSTSDLVYCCADVACATCNLFCIL